MQALQLDDPMPDETVDGWLKRLAATTETVSHILDVQGGQTLGRFVDSQTETTATPCQPREDLLDIVAEECARLLGSAVAARVRAELAGSPNVLTANHHGVDYFAQSVQGSLIFSRRSAAPGRRAGTVPVLACGTIPLDNLTYPLGMLLYGVAPDGLDAWPRKLPVFSNKARRCQVSLAPAFDAFACQRASKRVLEMGARGEVSTRVAETAAMVLNDDYAAPEVLACDRYSDQAVMLNARLWRRLHGGHEGAGDLAYLELERIASRVLRMDLERADSLASRVLLDPEIRQRVVHTLDGDRSCWDTSALQARFQEETHGRANACGTVFFWGTNARGRRIPLTITRDDAGGGALVGVDDGNAPWRVELNAGALDQALEERRILPSIFTSFLVIAFARGFTCLGAYYQAAYLPRMRDAVAAALRASGEQVMAREVSSVPTAGYVAGMQAVVQEIRSGRTVPAGVLEIIAAGGLTAEKLALVDALTVRDAHVASLLESVPDLLGPGELGDGGRAMLADACTEDLDGRVPVV